MNPLLKLVPVRRRGGAADRRSAQRTIRNERDAFRRWSQRRAEDRYHP